jgi:S1-C subfamily serine protease
VLATTLIIAAVLAGTAGGPRLLRWLAPASPDPRPVADAPAPGPVALTPARAPLSSAEAAALERRVEPGIVDVVTEIPEVNAVGAGTGIVLSSDGEVLTNNHVINGAAAMLVTDLGDGHSYPATVVGYDRVHDLAVLRMRGASGLPVANLGDSASVQLGDQVAAIGNAGGVGGRPTVATGPVTDLGRTIATQDELTGGIEELEGLIEAGADVQPGDSGGPLVDDAGRVVGVNVATSVDSSTQRPDGTGFAIPIDDAMNVVSRIQSGTAGDAIHIGQTARLGVTLNDEYDQAEATGPTAVGAFVSAVSPGSPADEAGLTPTDVITAVDGTAIHSAAELSELLSDDHPGDRVRVQWADLAERTHSATVALAAGPPN